MGKYSGYLLCADLDGTLLNDEGKLVDINTLYLDKFMNQGGLFTVLTGRARNYLENKFGNALKTNTYGVALNGTVIYDKCTGEIKFEKFFKSEDLKGIDEFLENTEFNITLTRFHSGENVFYSFHEINNNEKINKVVFEFDKEENCLNFKSSIEKVYNGFCFYCRSWDVGLEMLPVGGGKGECLKELRKLLGDKIHTIISVGNYENDISMINEADIGYATENAISAVKDIADRISVSNNEGAIADIISHII